MKKIANYGRPLRGEFLLAPDAVFLNHGSYGACPKEVLAEQGRMRVEMEIQPDRFFREGIVPREGLTPLRAALEGLAAFVGTTADRLAFVENATSGIQAVLRSLAFAPGDEILVTDHTYNAVRLMVEARCAETGATMRVVDFPWPLTPEGIVEALEAAATPAMKLAIVDHITSPTALLLPMERIVPVLKRHGARVIVDGAHAVGHVPLALDALGADWYVSNAHKWLWAPKGTAFLHASAEAAAITQPLVVSHYVGMGFPKSFDYVATRDYTAWLALPAAIRFHEWLEPPRAESWRRAMGVMATKKLAALDIRPIAGDELVTGSMRSYEVPLGRAARSDEGQELMTRLWRDHRIQAVGHVFRERLLLRLSMQAYVGPEDLDALVAALQA